MLKLRTTVSVMHITAHPDDEHGGVLTKLSRGDGARVTLLTLNRGESGDNAIGPQLFDALGLISTEELLVVESLLRRRSAVLHHRGRLRLLEGCSKKRLASGAGKPSFATWSASSAWSGRRSSCRGSRAPIATATATTRPPGLMAQEAFLAAGDPTRYPEQINEGLRPWSPAKVYVGGVRADEDWTVRVDTGEYDAVLGDSYDNVARRGLSFQRSQNSGRFTPTAGPNYGYYKLAARGHERSVAAAGAKEQSLLDSAAAQHRRRPIGAAGKPDRRGGGEGLRGVSRQRSVRERARPGPGPETDARCGWPRRSIQQVRHVLRIKEQQFQDAINAAMGMELTAVAQPAGMPEPTGPGAAFAPPALMAAPVPGQTFEVRARLANRGGVTAAGAAITIEGEREWNVRPAPGHRRTEPGSASAGHAARHGGAGRRRAAQHAAVLFAEWIAGEPLHAERSVAVRQTRVDVASHEQWAATSLTVCRSRFETRSSDVNLKCLTEKCSARCGAVPRIAVRLVTVQRHRAYRSTGSHDRH